MLDSRSAPPISSNHHDSSQPHEFTAPNNQLYGGDLERGAMYVVDPIPLDKHLPRSIRHGFIRKVFAVLVIMLSITFGFASLLGLYLFPKEILTSPHWWALGGAVVAIVLLIATMCCPKLQHRAPWNYFIVILIAASYAFVLGYAVFAVSPLAFAVAMGLTATMVIFLGLFAVQTKYDFTGCGPYLMVALIALIGFGIFAIIFRSEVLHLLYSCFGAFLFAIYFIVDIQLIVGGRNEEMSIDDYIMGALMLYIDIINIFVYILSIVGMATGD